MKNKINKSNQDLIKEKLLKGCGENIDSEMKIKCGNILKIGTITKGIKEELILCAICEAKLKQHEETKKAERERFNKILDNLEKFPYCNRCKSFYCYAPEHKKTIYIYYEKLKKELEKKE